MSTLRHEAINESGTYTDSKLVKQEIAKEGVLPFSLFFANSTTTPWARFRQRFWPSEKKKKKQPRYQPEQSPAAALFLHWMFSMVMIASTSSTTPDVAYTVLVWLYTYTVDVLIGFFVASGLLYLRYFGERKEWTANSGFKPWGGPTAAIIYTAVCAYLLAAAFVPPTSGSPFAKSTTGIEWYTVPTVGLGSLVLVFVYYLIFKHVYPPLLRGKKVLVVEREAVIVHEHGEYVQALEIVDASWEARPGPGSNDDAEMLSVSMMAK